MTSKNFFLIYPLPELTVLKSDCLGMFSAMRSMNWQFQKPWQENRHACFLSLSHVIVTYVGKLPLSAGSGLSLTSEMLHEPAFICVLVHVFHRLDCLHSLVSSTFSSSQRKLIPKHDFVSGWNKNVHHVEKAFPSATANKQCCVFTGKAHI